MGWRCFDRQRYFFLDWDNSRWHPWLAIVECLAPIEREEGSMTIHANVTKGLLAVIAVLLIAFTPTAQTPQSTKPDSPALEDTLKWIQTKVSSFSYVRDKDSGDIDKTEDITYSGCKIDLQLSSRHNESRTRLQITNELFLFIEGCGTCRRIPRQKW